jgi:exodeoxyribonuclease V alpha subunit
VAGNIGSLDAVSGIGKVKAQKIRESWAEETPSTPEDELRSTLRDVVELLARHKLYNLGKLCESIVDAHGTKSMERIQTDPYLIDNIGFKKADKIAMGMRFAKDDHRRIRAGLLGSLKKTVGKNGHTAVTRTVFVSIAKETLNLVDVDNKIVDEGIDCLKREEKIECIEVNGQFYVQSSSLARAEVSIVASLNRIKEGKRFIKRSEVDNLLASSEASIGHALSGSQREAVRKGLGNKVSIITGGPGTGKTAMFSALVSTLKKRKDAKVALAAPTGVAAQRFVNGTEFEASTIHKLLKWDGTTGSFHYNEHERIYADYVFVDEASMLDTHLLANLLEALPSSCHLVIHRPWSGLGRHGQLRARPGHSLGLCVSSGTRK